MIFDKEAVDDSEDYGKLVPAKEVILAIESILEEKSMFFQPDYKDGEYMNLGTAEELLWLIKFFKKE
ncbi:hypothetical protein ACXM0N_09790 [Peribacillus simplex]